MSNRNSLLNQKLCHYLNEGRTLNDLLSWQTKIYFKLLYWKRSNPNCSGDITTRSGQKAKLRRRQCGLRLFLAEAES